MLAAFWWNSCVRWAASWPPSSLLFFILRLNSASGRWVMLDANLTLFSSSTTCYFFKLSLARVRLRLLSSIVFKKSLTSPTDSSFSSVIWRVSLSICLTALLRSLKRAVSMGKSAALRWRQSSLSCLRYSIPLVMLRHRFFSMVPARLLIRREWRLEHF
jgi:hypothetical protein